MRRLISGFKIIFTDIGCIITYFFKVGIFSLIPIGILSYVNNYKYKAMNHAILNPEKAVDAINKAQTISIVCYISIVIIALLIIRSYGEYITFPTEEAKKNYYAKLKRKKHSLSYSSSSYPTSYSTSKSFSSDDREIYSEDTFCGDRVYRNRAGKVKARIERGIFGDEIVREADGREIGRGEYDFLSGKTIYRDKNYNVIAEKENTLFGSKVKTKDGDTYSGEDDWLFGSRYKKDNW